MPFFKKVVNKINAFFNLNENKFNFELGIGTLSSKTKLLPFHFEENNLMYEIFLLLKFFKKNKNLGLQKVFKFNMIISKKLFFSL